MTNYDCDVSPEKILDKLSALLCEERIAKEVDEPIDLAAHNFRLKITIPINHFKFNQVIAAFVRHLYRNGVALSHGLSEQEALAEAIFLARLTFMRVLQWGQVLVFKRSAAKNKPPHWLHTMIKVGPIISMPPKDFTSHLIFISPAIFPLFLNYFARGWSKKHINIFE